MSRKRVLALALLSAFVFSAVAGMQFFSLAAANFMPPPPELPHVYIRGGGNVDPATLPIQRVGEVYFLTGNIFNLTLEVQRGNIILDGAGHTFQGNGSGIGIILHTAGNVTIRNLKMTSFRMGIDVENSSGNKVTENEIANSELGIWLNNASSNQITGNQITANSQALILYASSDYNSFSENNVTENRQGGIRFEFTNYNETDDNNSIVGNNITQNGGYAIMVEGSGNNHIEGNNILGNEYGISLGGSSCDHNLVIGNEIVSNNQSNIAIGGDAKYNTVTENTIANSEIGIDIFNSNSSEFYRNDFFNNKKQVNNGYVNDSFISLGPAVNVWDKNFEGNYWSDYNGTDANGDGIGDSPYVIDATNQDHYPLVTPYNGPLPVQISMPEECLNYTISVVNGTLWAKIDGTYPMHLSGYDTSLPMVYPTPPNTTNMHIWLDDAELSWSNFSEIDPTATHHTDIGDWQMIYALVAPSSPDFVLKIHYEHPVQVINGTYTFLYDLNISPYLSLSSPNSTAHFSIRVEANCSSIDVYTTGLNGVWNPMNYASAKDGNGETVSFDIVSEYDKPLLGDIAVALVDAQVPEFPTGIFLAAAVAAVTLVSFVVVFGARARKRL